MWAGGILFAAALVAALGLLVLSGYERVTSAITANSARVTNERAQRELPIMHVAPAALPKGLPLVERPGTDAYGYPRSYVDGPALRSLLHHERYQELTAHFEEFQREFEADPVKEFWPIRAAESFASAEPTLLPQLEAWMQASSTSFAPHLALGAYFREVAYTRRGEKWFKDTPAADIAAMQAAAERAQHHLNQALAFSPKLVAAMRISISTPDADRARAEATLARGTALCPSCFLLRSAHIVRLTPRWGGSYEEMQAFAAKLPSTAHPRLKLLIGYADVDRSKIARREKRHDDALALANAACALGDHWDFLEERARVWMAMQRYDEAQKDLDLAVDMRPELPSLRFARSELFVRKEAWESAAADLLIAARVDATDSSTRWLMAKVVRGLSAQGWAAHQAGRRDEAIRLLDLAEQLSPFDREVHERREQAVRGNVTGTPEEIAALETKVKEKPDDFATIQQLDYALARNRSYARVIELWTAYLGRHPDDARALFERGGAYYNSGHRTEASADAEKACQLGLDQACAVAKQMLAQ